MAWAEDSVVTDLGASARKHMLQKPAKKLDSGDSGMTDRLRTVIAVLKGHRSVVNGFDPAVGDGNAKNVAAQVIQNLVARAGMLAMNDPAFLPDGSRDALEQTCLFQPRADLGAEDDR
jgi:hypothetical protein